MKNIWKIIRISKPLHGIVYVLCFLIVAGAVLQLFIPFISKLIVDQIVAKVQGTGGDLNRLYFLIFISFVIGFVGIVAGGLGERVGDHFAGKLRQYLTELFYDKILRLPQEYYDSEISGKIVNQLSRGIVTIQGFINTSSNFILPTILQSILTVGLMAYYSPPAAFFTSLLFPVYLSLSYYSTKRWGTFEVRKNAIEDVTRGRIQEVIANMKLVKSFINEKNEYALVSKNLTDINKLYAKQSTQFHIFDFFRNLSLIIIFLVVNIVIFYNTFHGVLTIGEMVLLLQLFAQADRPLFAMSFILTQVQTAESGSKEFIGILELEGKEDYLSKIPNVKIQNPKIQFKNVWFRYRTSEGVLKDVSFVIESGEKVALVGHSGVGKSTVVNLILKFYEPTKGDIFLKNKNYKTLDHRFVRNNISLVFQENELFSASVLENVTYGSGHATENEAIKALKLANAWDFVQKLPKGIHSQVGERGVRLSGGQKQRIQIARALLKDSSILILDEATSSLDSKSEREVQKGLENLMKNRLTIIIAHRFSTIQNVDKVIVIDEGRVVDYGSPKELSTKQGVYRDLLTYQIEGNKKLLEQFEIY